MTAYSTKLRSNNGSTLKEDSRACSVSYSMIDYLQEKIEAILFAAGDTVRIDRISLILGTDPEDIIDAAKQLAESYEKQNRGIRIVRIGDKLQMVSNPDFSSDIIKVLEHRKPPRLSAPALETLSIVAYYQPVTRAYIDQIRGVDSSYTVSVLMDKGLIDKQGYLNVPGRPALYATTDLFLRTMGITNIDELPELPDVSTSEGVLKLQEQIEQIKESQQIEGQISLYDSSEEESVEKETSVQDETAASDASEVQGESIVVASEDN